MKTEFVIITTHDKTRKYRRQKALNKFRRAMLKCDFDTQEREYYAHIYEGIVNRHAMVFDKH